MKKYFDEFTEEEKIAVKKLVSSWFISEMSDSYAATQSEHAADLKAFNEKFGYQFTGFCPSFYGDDSKTFFIGYDF